MSTSQFISLMLAPLSLVMLIWLSRTRRHAPQDARSPPTGGVSLVEAQVDSPSRPSIDGQRLDRFLVSHLDGYSRSQIQKLIADGLRHAWRGATRARPTSRCATAITCVIELPDAQRIRRRCARRCRSRSSTRTPTSPSSTSRRAWWSIPAAGHASGTLVNALLHHLTDLSGIGGELRPGIVHRLDRGTSGVMVVAKNDAAHQELARQFHDREVEKEYIALVWGVVQAGRRIDAAIGRDPANRQKMSARAKHGAPRGDADHARASHARPDAVPGGDSYRPHASDPRPPERHRPSRSSATRLYGGVHRRVAGDIRAVQRLERPFLHAARLAFTHPRDGRRMEFIAPLPDDLSSVLDDLPGWPPEDADGRKSR